MPLSVESGRFSPPVGQQNNDGLGKVDFVATILEVAVRVTSVLLSQGLSDSPLMQAAPRQVTLLSGESPPSSPPSEPQSPPDFPNLPGFELFVQMAGAGCQWDGVD